MPPGIPGHSLARSVRIQILLCRQPRPAVSDRHKSELSEETFKSSLSLPEAGIVPQARAQGNS